MVPFRRSFVSVFTFSKRRAKRCVRLNRAVVEGLESRLFLSTYEVTSLADVASSAPNYVGTLRWAVQQANADGAHGKGPDIIDFAPAVTGTIVLTQGALSLTAGRTTIKGPGSATLSVSGGAASSVFQVDSGVTATISGLTITDGAAADNGGGIYNDGKLTVAGCTFTEDLATDGGGIANEAGGSLTVTNCTFADDSSYDLGGAIYNLGAATVSGSTFSSNAAISGGSVANSGKLTVTSSTFSDDTGADVGGGFCNYGTLCLTNCQFTYEVADNGGGIYNLASLTATNCTFSDNPAGENDDGDGGGIDNFGAATVAGATFYENSASDGGGAIDNELGGTLHVNNSTFSYDFAEFGGGIANDYGGTTTVTNSSFSDEASVTEGGGIYNDGKLNVSCCTFSLDSAGADISFTDAQTPSIVPLATGNGGAIANEVQGALTVTSSTFYLDSVIGYGGGIYNTGSATVAACTFSIASSDSGGGGIYNSGVMAVSNSTFSGDLSDIGAGIWNLNSLTVTGSTFSSDAAETEGGGIANDGVLTLKNSTLAGNSANTFGGGGIYNNGTLTATNCTLAYNQAGAGGGIYVDSGGDATIYNTIVADNTLLDGVTPSDIFGTLDAELSAGQTASSNNMIGPGGSGGLVNGVNGNIILVSDSSADLGTLANNGGPTQTIALLSGSRAINTGSVALAKAAGLTTDQRGPGFARIIHNGVDIGAYQIQ